ILSHACRRRGGRVAGGDVGAAAGEATDHRVLGLGYAYGPWPLGRCFFAAAARTRLDRRSQPRHRVSLGGGKPRSRRRVRVRVRPTQSRYYCHICGPNGSRGKAGDIDHPDRLRGGSGPGWHRVSHEFGAAGRQRYRTVRPAHRACWQAPRTFARDCSESPPAGGHGQCGQSRIRTGTGRGPGGGRHARSRSCQTRNPAREDIARAFEELKGRAEALYVCADTLLFAHRIRINTLALAARLPTMLSNRENVAAGGLAHYGANFPDLFRRAGDYVDKILRGAKPGDIPVEQPTRFDLVVNLTTAKALGLTIPGSFLWRADEVIE